MIITVIINMIMMMTTKVMRGRACVRGEVSLTLIIIIIINIISIITINLIIKVMRGRARVRGEVCSNPRGEEGEETEEESRQELIFKTFEHICLMILVNIL